MNKLKHTHTEDPLSKATCNACIVSRYTNMHTKAQLARKRIPKEKWSEWGSKGRAFLKEMTKEEKSEYFRKVRAGEQVK